MATSGGTHLPSAPGRLGPAACRQEAWSHDDEDVVLPATGGHPYTPTHTCWGYERDISLYHGASKVYNSTMGEQRWVDQPQTETGQIAVGWQGLYTNVRQDLTND